MEISFISSAIKLEFSKEVLSDGFLTGDFEGVRFLVMSYWSALIYERNWWVLTFPFPVTLKLNYGFPVNLFFLAFIF